MKRAVFTLVLLAGGLGVCSAAPVAVEFLNASRVTPCAEEDNVYVKLVAEGVTSFRINAEHPPYIAAVSKDRSAPDFTACDMSHDPSFAFAPRTVVLYEDADIRLVGHTFATFWRPDIVNFRVGGKNEPGLHLVQLVKRGPPHDIEILVVYPADGYWRVKPLPPPALVDSAYGSSFLFGPIEEGAGPRARPFVAISSIAFEPATMTFRVSFRNKATGVLTVAGATHTKTSLAVMVDPPVAGRPFAALRSMFVTPAQADVAVAAWSEGTSGSLSAPILEFSAIKAHAARFGRVEQSHHNLSAPDLVFEEFATAVQAHGR